MTAEQWVCMEAKHAKAIKAINEATEAMRASVVVPPMDKLRPMKPADVKVGRVVYGSGDGVGPCDYWIVIEEVYNQHDDFKAYAAHGCRHGLHKHYVRK